jgi:heme/copper-type cytochrome/quinol oxidase subunit 3
MRPTVQVAVPGSGRAAVRPTRPVLDLAELPDVVFRSRDIMWWGTLGFAVIEGFTLAICAVSYVYLGQNFQSWPPQGTRNPDVLVPTIQVAVMLLSLPFVRWMEVGAHRFDAARVRIGLTVATLFSAAVCALRAVELLASLNVKWDTNAYGSAQWLVVGSHATLLAVQFIEVAGMALVFWLGKAQRKHFSDASDVAFYWYFIVLVWMPLYVLCFLAPRWV